MYMMPTVPGDCWNHADANYEVRHGGERVL